MPQVLTLKRWDDFEHTLKDFIVLLQEQLAQVPERDWDAVSIKFEDGKLSVLLYPEEYPQLVRTPDYVQLVRDELAQNQSADTKAVVIAIMKKCRGMANPVVVEREAERQLSLRDMGLEWAAYWERKQ